MLLVVAEFSFYLFQRSIASQKLICWSRGLHCRRPGYCSLSCSLKFLRHNKMPAPLTIVQTYVLKMFLCFNLHSAGNFVTFCLHLSKSLKAVPVFKVSRTFSWYAQYTQGMQSLVMWHSEFPRRDPWELLTHLQTQLRSRNMHLDGVSGKWIFNDFRAIQKTMPGNLAFQADILNHKKLVNK